MSEHAPNYNDVSDLENVVRNFELIQHQFERTPDGPLYSAIWDVGIDVDDLRMRRHPTDAEKKAMKEAAAAGNNGKLNRLKPIITTGPALLTEIFYQIDFLQTPERLAELEQGKKYLMSTHEQGHSESDQFLLRSIDCIITVHSNVKRQLTDARDIYYSDKYWADPDYRKGLKSDELELLFEYTEQYEDRGLLGALDTVARSNAFSQDIVFEANRIARIMVAREINAIE